MNNSIVGLSKCDSDFVRYTGWLGSGGIDYIVLDYHKENSEDLKQCSFLILTGGNDVHPDFSGLSHETGEIYKPERDKFELKLLENAFEMKMPVLGICRGMQLINLFLNGTLVQDIETKFPGLNHKKINNTIDRYHTVKIKEDTLIYDIVRCSAGEINSSHHQCVDIPSDKLDITGYAHNFIPESFEWKNKNEKSILLGIQWHPERMMDKESPFTKNILDWVKETTANYNNKTE